MMLEVQQNYGQEKSVVSTLNGKQTEKAEKASTMTPEEEMLAFKKEFYADLEKITCHRTVKNMAIQISEKAFENMKADPNYRAKIMSLIQRDVGDSYAPRDCSVLIMIGATSGDYRADSWPIINDSDYHIRSQNSFYKRSSESKSNKQKDLMEEYIEKRQKAMRMQQELLEEESKQENITREYFKKREVEKAYNNQMILQ